MTHKASSHDTGIFSSLNNWNSIATSHLVEPADLERLIPSSYLIIKAITNFHEDKIGRKRVRKQLGTLQGYYTLQRKDSLVNTQLKHKTECSDYFSGTKISEFFTVVCQLLWWSSDLLHKNDSFGTLSVHILTCINKLFDGRKFVGNCVRNGNLSKMSIQNYWKRVTYITWLSRNALVV